MELDEDNPVVDPDITFEEKERFEGEAIDAFEVKEEIFLIFKDKLIRSSSEKATSISCRMIAKSDTHLAICGIGIESEICVFEIREEMKMISKKRMDFDVSSLVIVKDTLFVSNWNSNTVNLLSLNELELEEEVEMEVTSEEFIVSLQSLPISGNFSYVFAGTSRGSVISFVYDSKTSSIPNQS